MDYNPELKKQIISELNDFKKQIIEINGAIGNKENIINGLHTYISKLTKEKKELEDIENYNRTFRNMPYIKCLMVDPSNKHCFRAVSVLTIISICICMIFGIPILIPVVFAAAAATYFKDPIKKLNSLKKISPENYKTYSQNLQSKIDWKEVEIVKCNERLDTLKLEIPELISNVKKKVEYFNQTYNLTNIVDYYDNIIVYNFLNANLEMETDYSKVYKC